MDARALAKKVTIDVKPLLGRRYHLPLPVAYALERVFEQSVADVVVIEHSRYARAHRGMWATTRPNRILLAISGQQFISNAELLLHEYFHVLRQWGTGELTRSRYVRESLRYGYWMNRFEREAREFTASAEKAYLTHLKSSREAWRYGNSTVTGPSGRSI